MTLRLGLAGHGRWGRNIERTLQGIGDVAVTILGKGEKVPAALDGVIVATQSAAHAEVALPYIEAGIATFIEKPMATTVGDARRIRDAAERHRTVVFVGHIYLYNPAFLRALELLPSLGGVRYLLCEGMNSHTRTDSSVLWDWLPHHLSAGIAIYGRDPDRVSAWNLSDAAQPQAAHAKFDFGDASVISTVSWLSPVQRRLVTIAGSKATLVLDDLNDRRLALHEGDGQLSYPAYGAELPLTRELADFVAAIRSGKPDPRQIQIGVSVVSAIAAAEDSIRRGGQAVAILSEV
jgi:UDP-N-acetylglucosamine 3-dehydrogenase